MRTRLKHAENGAKSGKPESVQNQSEKHLESTFSSEMGVANKVARGNIKLWG